VYVADALDDTVLRLDAQGGHPAGPPRPAGPTPWQLAHGPDGALLVLSSDPDRVGELTLLGGPGGREAPRRVAVGARTRQALLAADGGPLAAVAYTARGGPAPAPPAACGLDVVDARAGRVVRTHAVCASEAEAVTGLAVENGPAGATVYLAVARPPAAGTGAGAGGAENRVVALDAASGARLAVLPLAGLAGSLVLARAPDGAGPRLYAIELAAATNPEESAGDGARLLRLDPATLAVERAYPLGFRPRGLAVAPDDERAYALAGAEGRLVELDLRGGAQRQLAQVPGAAPGLAVAGPRLYVPDPSGGAVLVLDRRSGDLLVRARVGRRPASVLAVGPI
jgi:DNA-binding beta-propeller fold protein YncE